MQTGQGEQCRGDIGQRHVTGLAGGGPDELADADAALR